jgi:coenzyme F420-reducing hydrogenase beta subunit
MKEFWLKKDECTACGACVNICPKKAIYMETDEFGFDYPKITENCIDCDACESVCSRRGFKSRDNDKLPLTYAAWSNDSLIRFKSTSGGVFTELSRVVLRQGGFVVGAKYNEDNSVEHAIIQDEDGLEKIRQSKYIQSDIADIYTQIRDILNKGRKVAFCGAPCQVVGLYAYLGKDYNNLITFDFICRGMNSPKAYRSWLDEIEEEVGSKANRVWFKYKTGGWKKSPRCTKIDFKNGKNLILDQDKNLFMSGYLGPNLYIRPCCGNCQFKGVPRQADITMADFWGLDPSLDDDKGTSMVLINNVKGGKIFSEAIENLVVYERNFHEIFEGNVCFSSSVSINPKSKQFLKELDSMRFSDAIRKYTKVSFVKRMMSHIKSHYPRRAKTD